MQRFSMVSYEMRRGRSRTERRRKNGEKTVKRVVRGAAVVAAVTLAALLATVARNSADAPLMPKPAGAVRVASHNVHYIVLSRQTGAWSVSDWERRREPLDAAFKALDADIVAFQEMESFGGGDASRVNLALDWLLARNPGYAAAAAGDPSRFPSTQPILYRADRFAVEDEGWYFFSETPGVLYSRTFDGSYPAFASWAAFRDMASGARFRVVNVHFDYRSRENRLRSADLVARRTAPLVAAGQAIVLAGDINAWHGTRTMRILEDAGLDFAPVRGSTYHFDRGLNLLGPIDHIATGPGIRRAGAPAVLRDRYGDTWPSDHYPVAVDLWIGQGGPPR